MKRDFTVRHGALDGVEAFLAVAKHLNFRKAAGDLGVTPSAIGQAVRALETRVGAALFTRTTRSVGLTQAGARFRARVGPAFAELVEAAAAARQIGEQPEGLLRLTVPRAVVAPILQPVVAGFCRAYPDIELEVSVSEQLVDIVSGGFDAGIRIGNLLEADMVKVRLTPPFRLVVVGSPSYFARHGRPDKPDGLREHACLRLRRTDGSLAPWQLQDRGDAIEAHVAGPFIANEYPTLLAAAIEGTGLAHVPEPIAAELIASGKLITALDDFAVTAPGVFLFYPDRRQILPKLRAFIDYLAAHPVAAIPPTRA